MLPVSKTGKPERVSRVRISPSPLVFPVFHAVSSLFGPLQKYFGILPEDAQKPPFSPPKCVVTHPPKAPSQAPPALHVSASAARSVWVFRLIVLPSLACSVVFAWLAFYWIHEFPKLWHTQTDSIHDGEAQAIASIVATLLCLAVPVAIQREQAQRQRPGFTKFPPVVIPEPRQPAAVASKGQNAPLIPAPGFVSPVQVLKMRI